MLAATMEQLEASEVEPATPVGKAWFVLTIIYLFIDCARPQDLVKALDYIHLGMISVLALLVFTLRNLRLIDWKIPQVRLILLFIILLILEIPFAVNKHFAFDTALGLLLYLPFVFSCICSVDSKRKLKSILFFAVLFLACQSQFAIRHHGCGTGAQMYDENDFSLYVNTWLPFCFMFFLSEKAPWKKILFGLITALGLAASVIGRSRGGFMGLIVMFFIFWLFNPRKLVSLLIIGVVGLSLYMFAGDKYWSRIATSSDTQHGTAKERIESWRAGWNMFLHNPLGVGGNNYQIRFTEYQSSWFRRGMWGRVAHSLWFTLLPETGIIGVAIFFSLLFINIRDIFRLRNVARYCRDEDARFIKNLSVALLGSLAGFFSSASFISVLYYPHYWYLCAFISTIVLVANRCAASNSYGDSTAPE
jgi:hypothetical protein